MTDPELQAAAKVMNEGMRKVEHSFRAMAQAFLPALRTFGEQLAIVSHAIEEATDKAYEDAGMPYGPGRDAKWRWLNKMAERERMIEAAAEVRAWERAAQIVRDARERTEGAG